MNDYHAVPSTEPVFDLAEGIIWDDRRQRVRWVDIQRGRVHEGEVRSGELVTLETVEMGQTVGAVALAEDGGLLVAAARSLVTLSPDRMLSFGPDLLGSRADVRFNDGSVDPFGDFVLGTVSTGAEPPPGERGREVLLRVSSMGAVEVVRDGIGLSNGIAFSPDGGTIYHVDTVAGTVSRHSWSAAKFDHHEPWVTLALGLGDAPNSLMPDGLVVDSSGALWIAFWGGWCVRRYTPSGTLLDTVTIQASQASCPGFVGPNEDVLAITSASTGLEASEELAGAIFLADLGAELGIRGVPSPRWKGSTASPYWL